MNDVTDATRTSPRRRLTLASLNTRGTPPFGTRLAERYAAIAGAFEAAEVDVVAFQEMFTYRHLRRLTRRMPSFRHVSYRPSAAGPAGGLATLSRVPIAESGYRAFPAPLRTAGLPLRARISARLKGSLVTRLSSPQVCVVNTHPVANTDGDWSESNRFHPLHRQQLAALASTVRAMSLPSVVCGDFNVARDSELHRAFLTDGRLSDAFEGRCPPTFHSHYLSRGKTPQCIDFILVTDGIEVTATDVLFAGRMPLPNGPDYVSDHVGLRASVLLPVQGGL